MATEGPTENSTEEENSFCDRIRYWIGGPIQVHMLRSVQIAIIFAAGCELKHRSASREEKKFRTFKYILLVGRTSIPSNVHTID